MATYGPTFVSSTSQPTTSRKRKKKAPAGALVQVGQGVPQSISTSAGPSQGVSGPPVDPALEAQRAAADNSIRLGGIWDTYQTGQINTAYGNLDNPTSDLTSNPYSRAALLQQSYNNQRRGTTNSYASQGQLYAGSLQNAQEANLTGYNQNLDALRKERQGSLDEILKGGLDRYSQVGASMNSETLQAILRALGA